MTPRPRPHHVTHRGDDDDRRDVRRKGPRVPHPGNAGKPKPKRDPSGHRPDAVRPHQAVPHPGKSGTRPAANPVKHPGKAARPAHPAHPAKASEDTEGDDEDDGILGFGAADDGDEGEDADEDGDDVGDDEEDGEEFGEAADLDGLDDIPDTEAPGSFAAPPGKKSGKPAAEEPAFERKPGKTAHQKPKPHPSAKPTPDAAKAPGTPAERAEKLDGEGRRYVTLAQFLKHIDVVPTGGAAKAMARSGTILVAGVAENRPGRKLHQGDEVIVDGKPHRVDLG